MRWFKILVSFLGLVGLISGHVLIFTEEFGVCIPGKIGCVFGGYEFSIGEPLFNISIAFFAASLLFFFVSGRAFYRWLGFSIVYLALSAYLVYLAPVSHQSPLMLDMTKEDASRLLALLFFILSFIYFLVRFFRERPN
jgi:hypothetical protein